MTFPSPLRLPIRNHLTGRTYKLVRADAVEITPASLARIVSICNEPKVYEWLFRELLEGRPYGEAQARWFLEWSRAGWSAGTHFVFTVLDDAGNIAAACDIKSGDSIAEVGYWASQQHRGVMTNAVKALCGLAADAGFRGLFASPKAGNRESQAVLERAGFVRSPIKDNGDDRFELSVNAKAPAKKP